MLAFCKRLSLVAGTVAGLALVSGAAQAQTTTTDTFDVMIQIDAFCAITNPTNLDFGTNTLLNANIDVQTDFDVQCTNTTPYDVGLDLGNNPTGGGVRQMTDGTSFVSYELYSNSFGGTPWDNTGNLVSATGTGNVVNYPVYGRVPPQTTPAPGNYIDTVTIEVTY